MDTDIRIVSRPDSVSWDAIHELLYAAHAENRARGIRMRNPSLPGEEIRRKIGDGVMLVAMDGDKPVGTAALVVRRKKTWYHKGAYGYLCFDAVLPEYGGKGIYAALCRKREEIARQMGLDTLCFDTHHDNRRAIEVAENQGFVRVGVWSLKTHWNVVMCKWLNSCPPSPWRCALAYSLRRTGMHIRRFFKGMP